MIKQDALRGIGDRLEWVFPLEASGEMRELIGPLFLLDAQGGGGQDGGGAPSGRPEPRAPTGDAGCGLGDAATPPDDDAAPAQSPPPATDGSIRTR